jgi:hypothetical protein
MHMALRFSASEMADEALSVPSGGIAGFGAWLLVNIALVLLRVSAVAILASPLLFIWLAW